MPSLLSAQPFTQPIPMTKRERQRANRRAKRQYLAAHLANRPAQRELERAQQRAAERAAARALAAIDAQRTCDLLPTPSHGSANPGKLLPTRGLYRGNDPRAAAHVRTFAEGQRSPERRTRTRDKGGKVAAHVESAPAPRLTFDPYRGYGRGDVDAETLAAERAAARAAALFADADALAAAMRAADRRERARQQLARDVRAGATELARQRDARFSD